MADLAQMREILLHARHVQGQYRLQYHRTLGGCNPIEAFCNGPDGALADWLQPYDGLSNSSVTDVPRQLGLLRDVRPSQNAKRARTAAVLPWTTESTGKHGSHCGIPPLTCFCPSNSGAFKQLVNDVRARAFARLWTACGAC